MASPHHILHRNLDVLVLNALSIGPMHGYAISDCIEQYARSELELLDSALYQALGRLEARRLVKPAVGRRQQTTRQFVHRTDAGRATLRADAARWQRYAATINTILAAPAKG